MRARVWWVLILAFALLQFLAGLNEIWDDAFIGLIYAKNIARGVGPVFLPFSQTHPTPESFVEGYSNPLWIALLAFGYLLPGSAFFWVKLFSYASAVLLAWSCYGLTRFLLAAWKSRLPGWVLWIAPLLVLFDRGVFLYAKSGLETNAFAALVIGAVWHTSRLVRAPSRLQLRLRETSANAGLWILVALMRPEGVLYAAAAGLFLLVTAWRVGDTAGQSWLNRFPWRTALAWGLVFGGLFSAFLVWRGLYYHDWLPNTYYTRVRSTGALRAGGAYLLDYLREGLPPVRLALALAVLAWITAVLRRPLALILTMVVCDVAFVLYVGGDFWPMFRLMQIASCLAIVLAATTLGLLACGERPALVGKWLSAARVRAPLAVILAVALVVIQPMTRLLFTRDLYGWHESLAERSREFLSGRRVTPAFLLGKWIKEQTPTDAVIGVDQSGQIPYYSERETVDLLALNDHYLARHPLRYDYLKKRNVSLVVSVVVSTNGKRDLLYPQLLRETGFQRDFALTHVFQGVDQHRRLQTFVIFSRQDRLRSATWTVYPLGSGTLDTILRNGPRPILLTPELVRDLEP